MCLREYLQSSIGKKQIVAVTGLMLILFLIGHLAGNLLIFKGAATFNAYAKKLSSLRPGLYIIEVGLLFVFISHMWVTALLVLENIKARSRGYAVTKSSPERSWATQLMPYSGTIILVFVVVHLLDFTFIDKTGARSILADGQSYGLYGVVVNSFSNPLHSGLYILAMFSLALHLSHGVQSFLQTFGWNSSQTAKSIQMISNSFAIFVAIGYSSIPISILIHTPKP